MNNDARFFFCLCGFAGFVLFFSLGWILTGNAFDALLRGSIGCLVLGVGGRILLGTLLRSLLENTSSVGEGGANSYGHGAHGLSKSNSTPEELAVQASAQATSEAAAGVEPGVNTSA
jgi:hypothetical protein